MKVQLKNKTRDYSPKGKAKVYISYHPDNFSAASHVADLILKYSDCAVYYYDYESFKEPDERELSVLLKGMQLFVIPVTEKYLTEKSLAYDFEFKFAKEYHIPILPLLQQDAPEPLYSGKFGALQYLNEYRYTPGEIPFSEKLRNYLDSVIIDSETMNEVQDVFDAYIFLSYRKKDREFVGDLMATVHKDRKCRNLAVWYDEFLVAGEAFDDAINEMIKKSKLFLLLVTPNLINEDNYVKDVEYPMAKGMKVVAVESIPTDRKELEEKFKNIPPCIDSADEEKIIERVKALAMSENYSPEHNFLLGLAYLMGIYVERNPEYAIELISGSAESGYAPAMKKFSEMCYNGDGCPKDVEKATFWQEKYVKECKSSLENAVCDKAEYKKTAKEYLKACIVCGDYEGELKDYYSEEMRFNDALIISEEITNKYVGDDDFPIDLISGAFIKAISFYKFSRFCKYVPRILNLEKINSQTSEFLGKTEGRQTVLSSALYYLLGENVLPDDHEKGISYFKQCVQCMENLNGETEENAEAIASFCFSSAYQLLYYGDPASALEFCEKALCYNIKGDEKSWRKTDLLKAKCFILTGTKLIGEESDYDKALSYYEKARSIAFIRLGIGEEGKLFNAHIDYLCGRLYLKKGEYDKAISCFKNALVVFEALPEEEERLLRTSLIYVHYCAACDGLGDEQGAVENYKKIINGFSLPKKYLDVPEETRKKATGAYVVATENIRTLYGWFGLNEPKDEAGGFYVDALRFKSYHLIAGMIIFGYEIGHFGEDTVNEYKEFMKKHV